MEPVCLILGPQFMAGPEKSRFARVEGCLGCNGRGYNHSGRQAHPGVPGGLPSHRVACESCVRAAKAFTGPMQAAFDSEVIERCFDETPWRYGGDPRRTY